MKSNIKAVIVFLVVFALLSVLPIVPIQTALVVPNQVYHLSFVPLVMLIWHYAALVPGVSYRLGWYTAVMVIVIPAVSLLAAVLISRTTSSSQV
jgi:hypothetical protein